MTLATATNFFFFFALLCHDIDFLVLRFPTSYCLRNALKRLIEQRYLFQVFFLFGHNFFSICAYKKSFFLFRNILAHCYLFDTHLYTHFDYIVLYSIIVFQESQKVFVRSNAD